MCTASPHDAVRRGRGCRNPAVPSIGPHFAHAAARQRVRPAVQADQAGRAAGPPPRVLHLEDRGHRRAAGRRLGRLRPGRATRGGSWQWPRSWPWCSPRSASSATTPGTGRSSAPGGPTTSLGILHGNLGIGLSYGWWVDKHNRHHAHPNTEDADPDIAIGALAFTAAPGARRPGRGPAGVPLPGLPVLPAAAARSDQPARRQRPRADQPGRPAPAVGDGAARRPRGRLPGRRVPGAVAGQGRGVHPGAAGPVRPVPGLLLRAQPQGHAHPGRGRPRATSCAARCSPHATSAAAG